MCSLIVSMFLISSTLKIWEQNFNWGVASKLLTCTVKTKCKFIMGKSTFSHICILSENSLQLLSAHCAVWLVQCFMSQKKSHPVSHSFASGSGILKTFTSSYASAHSDKMKQTREDLYTSSLIQVLLGGLNSSLRPFSSFKSPKCRFFSLLLCALTIISPVLSSYLLFLFCVPKSLV